ncbi:MAG: TIGR03643 family protein [Lutibacter sp.]|nr:TIGR03643 family protein [Lutibacter sp.]
MIAADYIENKEQNAISIDRIIEMAWEDRTPFEAIQYQFGLAEKEVIKLMRNQLKLNSFNLWRKRVNSKISQKHLKKRSGEIARFKCSRQRTISSNKISKR